jgi:hypothetical protein
MISTHESSRQNKASSSPARVRSFWLCGWCLRAGAALFMALGLLMLWAGFDNELLENERLLRMPDAVFGAETGTVLKLAGILQLCAGGYLLIAQDATMRAFLALWLSLVCTVYRFGADWIQTPDDGDSAFITLTAHKVGISPGAFREVWWVLLASMAAGAFWQLALQRRERKREINAAFMKQWRDEREGKSHSK